MAKCTYNIQNKNKTIKPVITPIPMEAAFHRFLGQSVTEEDNCPAPTKIMAAPVVVCRNIRTFGRIFVGVSQSVEYLLYLRLSICVVVINGLSTCISLIHEAYRTDSASACELS